MAFPAASVAVAAAVGAAGLFVLLVRSDRGAYKVLGGAMLLRGGFMGASALATAVPDETSALILARLSVAWLLGLPFLTLYLATLMWPRRMPREKLVLSLAGVATLLLVAAFAVDPSLLVSGVTPVPWGWGPVSGPLLYGYATLSAAADAAFVLVAARTAVDPATSDVDRRAAAAFGAAFGINVVRSAGFFALAISLSPERLAGPLFASRALSTLAAGALVVGLAPRLARPLRAGTAFTAGALALAGFGALDSLVIARPDLSLALPRYQGTETLWRLVFAAAILFATVRHGLAGAGDRERRRARIALRIILTCAAAVAVGLAALGTLGANVVGYEAAATVALVAVAVAWAPMDGVSRRVILSTDDPDAVAERARRYAAAISATMGPDGRILPRGDALLADLRRDLGITTLEHETIAKGLGSRETPGRYVLGAELDRGATAVVHLAVDSETGREVVVKRYHSPSESDRIVDEARALQAVRSPRVVKLIEVDRRDGAALLVMERAAGGSARALIDREGPPPPERAVALVQDLLEGLDALHAAGLVHGDVKCENLLLDEEGRGLLADFGSSRVADPSLTLTGAGVEGTLATLAPEVARGSRPTRASDLYSAGAVLYRLLTGEHPIDLAGVDAFSARERVLHRAPRLPHPRVPTAIEAPLRSALAKRPEDRPATAAAFRAALTAGRRDANGRP